MAQYKLGKASATAGSEVVTGVGTAWLSNVSAGDAFTIAGTSVIYDVASVQSDVQLSLSAPYSGSSVSETTYAITRDFTSPDNFPELYSGDIETPTILTRAIRKIQQRFNSGGTGTTTPPTGDEITTYSSLLLKSTLDLNFANNEYKVYEGLLGNMTAKPISDVLTVTRSSPAGGHTALGFTGSVGVNDPRLVGNREGILIEDSKENLLLWSEDFTQSAWTKSGTTVATLQDPFSVANKIVEDSSNGPHNISQSVSVTSGQTYTFSALIKPSGRPIITVEQSGAYTNNTFKFDLLQEAVVTQSDPRNYVKYMGEGWWMFSLTTPAASTGSGNHVVSLNNGSGSSQYVGDGSSGAYLWGAQTEIGEEASSYIKSESTAATRAADEVLRVLGEEFNSIEGTVFLDIDLASFLDSNNNSSKIMELSDGTTSTNILVETLANGSVSVGMNFSGNSYSASVVNSSQSIKLAVAYTQTALTLSVSGSTVEESTAFRTSGFSELRLGSSVGSGSMLGTVARFSHIPYALSVENLQALTA